MAVGTGALILVVEDDLAIRASLRELLSDEGYRVAEAAHGGEALERLAVELPSLVLLDLWMPVMTGLQLLKRMRDDSFWSAIPILVLTAAREVEPLDVEVLKKPVRLEVLLDAVSRHLKR